MILELRVIYGDTDQMGVVYYANYLRYFEAARGHYLRERGRPYAELEKSGINFPVIEASLKYRAPARYDELIQVDAVVDEVRMASLRFVYKITRGETLLVEGSTRHACLDQSGRPKRLPAEVLELVKP